MKQKPKAIAFDVVGTLFAIDPLEEKLKAAGLPDGSLKICLPRVLRDGFALEVAGRFKTFAEVASGALEVLLSENKIDPDEARIDNIIKSFAELPAHSDVEPAFRMLRDAGLPIFALTNGSAETTKNMFASSGLEDQVEQFISIDDVKHWKPAAAVYLHAAKVARVKPEELALVAAHDWDIDGASRAGLTTGYRGAEAADLFAGDEPCRCRRPIPNRGCARLVRTQCIGRWNASVKSVFICGSPLCFATF